MAFGLISPKELMTAKMGRHKKPRSLSGSVCRSITIFPVRNKIVWLCVCVCGGGGGRGGITSSCVSCTRRKNITTDYAYTVDKWGRELLFNCENNSRLHIVTPVVHLSNIRY